MLLSVEHNVLKVYNVKEKRKGEKDTQTNKHLHTYTHTMEEIIPVKKQQRFIRFTSYDICLFLHSSQVHNHLISSNFFLFYY